MNGGFEHSLFYQHGLKLRNNNIADLYRQCLTDASIKKHFSKNLVIRKGQPQSRVCP